MAVQYDWDTTMAKTEALLKESAQFRRKLEEIRKTNKAMMEAVLAKYPLL